MNFNYVIMMDKGSLLLQKNFGWPADPDEDGYHQMTDDQRNSMRQIHRHIHPACQVFIEHAELENGTYAAQST